MSLDDYLNSMTSQRIKILELENSKLALENNQLAKVIEEMSHEISKLNDKISRLNDKINYRDPTPINYLPKTNMTKSGVDYLVKTDKGDHYVAKKLKFKWYDSYSGDEISGVIKAANLS